MYTLSLFKKYFQQKGNNIMITELFDEIFNDSEELDITNEINKLFNMLEEKVEDTRIKFEEKFDNSSNKIAVLWEAIQYFMEADDDDNDNIELESLAEHSTEKECLLPYGLTKSEALEQADQSYQDFQARVKTFGFPLDDKTLLCQMLADYAQKQSSPELLRLYCDIVCDTGFLLDLNREQYTADSIKIQAWATGKQNADNLYAVLSERAGIALQFRELLSEAQKIRSVELQNALYDSQAQQEIYKLYKKLFRINEDCTYLLDNIAYLLQITESVNAFSVLKPLFFYRILTLHGKRLQKTEAIQINFGKLWDNKAYRIDTDNGKNHKTYLCYLMLFYRLCKIFESDSQVILPLNCYGFERLSNLGDFYRIHMKNKANISFFEARFDTMDRQHLLSNQLINIKDSVSRKYMETAVKFLIYGA